ncbi:MAG: 4-hydroxy-tetrahydrodipicolinate synthase, partial [Cytophagales bacterium]
VRNNNPHQVPIVYGIGGNNTQSVIENIKKNNFDKVTALLSVTPYYNKPSQNGLIAHYRAIADVSPVPVILYNVPGRTGINLKAETTLALAEHQNIIAVKKPKDFLLLSGDDLITPAMISFGAEGVISVLANAFPYQFSEMTRQALANNFQKSSQYLFNFLKINPLMYEESNPVGVKEALAQLNVCKNIVRLPLLASSKNLSERIKKVREENGL